MYRLACLLLVATFANAQNIKPIPPPGVEVSAADRADLETRLKRLQSLTAALQSNSLLPDVLIYQEAARYALQ